MFSLFSNILNYFFINFYAQVTPAYDAASKHLSSKGIQGQDLLVFIIFGIIAGIFIIFLIFAYFRERKRPRYLFHISSNENI